MWVYIVSNSFRKCHITARIWLKCPKLRQTFLSWSEVGIVQYSISWYSCIYMVKMALVSKVVEYINQSCDPSHGGLLLQNSTQSLYTQQFLPVPTRYRFLHSREANTVFKSCLPCKNGDQLWGIYYQHTPPMMNMILTDDHTSNKFQDKLFCFFSHTHTHISPCGHMT